MQTVRALLTRRHVQVALAAFLCLCLLMVHLGTTRYSGGTVDDTITAAHATAATTESVPVTSTTTTNSDKSDNASPPASPSLLALPRPKAQQPKIPLNHPLYSTLEPKNPDATAVDPAPYVTTTPQATTGPRHYSLLLIIFSDYRDSDRRTLLRRSMLGIHDNLQPCMQANGDILYKFAVRVPLEHPTQPDRLAALRTYQSETMEYGDTLELKADNVWDAQLALFRWVDTLKQTSEAHPRAITFSHMMFMDAYVFLRLNVYRVELASGIINNRVLGLAQQQRLYLTSDNARAPSFVVMATLVADMMVKFAGERTEPGDDLFAHFFESGPGSSLEVKHIADQRVSRWQNALSLLAKEALCITDVYLTEDYFALLRRFPQRPPVTCVRPANMFNLALVSSAYLYPDNCMLDAGVASARLKRSYAIRHGYSFVARSLEYAQQQRHKHRGVGWGRLDVIEKALPHYDWLLWTDMDVVLSNHTIRIFDLIRGWSQAKHVDFANKHLVVTRVAGDARAVDPGVMLVRNSHWSRDFLSEVQARREFYDRDDGVSRAIAEVMDEGAWSRGMLLLEATDPSLLVTSDHYRPSHFLVHLANAQQCPAEQVKRAVAQIEAADQNSAHT